MFWLQLPPDRVSVVLEDEAFGSVICNPVKKLLTSRTRLEDDRNWPRIVVYDDLAHGLIARKTLVLGREERNSEDFVVQGVRVILESRDHIAGHGMVTDEQLTVKDRVVRQELDRICDPLVLAEFGPIVNVLLATMSGHSARSILADEKTYAVSLEFSDLPSLSAPSRRLDAIGDDV